MKGMISVKVKIKNKDTAEYNGVLISGILQLTKALKYLPNGHYLEAMIPIHGGELIIVEHASTRLCTKCDTSEYIRTGFDHPASPEFIAHTIRQSLKIAEIIRLGIDQENEEDL